MRLTAIVTGALLLFATSASPQENGHVQDLLAAIAGKENKPAGEVFRNVKMMKDVPAGRFVRIMDTGFAKSLGVGCEHCHVTDRWEADEKRPKRATREMMKLVRQINDTLADMQDIDNADATVNCTTCHRGFVKPALQMK
ncbi:MAG TPA: photosynthetic reaction center cytochrome c subunit family protein [Thermoanaerobaculia bacterium]|nr:photosynthetic reaction center cytochrome c subunit family protein [Thermoanaerobaculia bacterium]